MMTPTDFVAQLAGIMQDHGMAVGDPEAMLASLEALMATEAAVDAQAVAKVFSQIRAEVLATFAGILVKEFGISEKRVARAARMTLDQLARIDAETVPEVARAILEEE